MASHKKSKKCAKNKKKLLSTPITMGKDTIIVDPINSKLSLIKWIQFSSTHELLINEFKQLSLDDNKHQQMALDEEPQPQQQQQEQEQQKEILLEHDDNDDKKHQQQQEQEQPAPQQMAFDEEQMNWIINKPNFLQMMTTMHMNVSNYYINKIR